MREKIALLLTCTAIEVGTTIGVTGYLLYLNKPILAMISAIVFAKLIAFHFVISYYDKKKKHTC